LPLSFRKRRTGMLFPFMSFGPKRPSPVSSEQPVEKELLSNRWSTLFSAAILLLFIGLRLWRLSASCLWFDEIFSIHAARHGWAELLRFVAADIIHPPLFYLLLKIWISVGGESLLWLRLLPALLSIATIIPFILLGKELELHRFECNLALLLLAVNGYLIKYAQELRMYSLLMFLSLCSLWLFIKCFKSEQAWRKHLGWLLFVNLLLVYSHYVGWIVVVVQTLTLVIWQRHKVGHFLAGVAVTMLAYVPWIVLVIQNQEAGKGLAQNIGWVSRPAFRDVTQFYALLNKPFWFVQSTAARPYDLLTAFFALLVLGPPLLLWSVRIWRSQRQLDDASVQPISLLFLFILAPIAFVLVLSWLLPLSVWGTRHLIIVAAPYAILAAVAVARLGRDWARTAVSLILGSWFLLAGITWALASPPVYIWCAWTPLARQAILTQSQNTEEVRVYAFEDLVAYHLWFAFDSSRHKQFKVAVVKNLEGIPEDPAYFLPRRFNEIAIMNSSQIAGDEIWVAYRATRWDTARPPLITLESLGYAVRSVFSIQAQGQEAFLVRMARK
jgi:uncharacterized membrane protein